MSKENIRYLKLIPPVYALALALLLQSSGSLLPTIHHPLLTYAGWPLMIIGLTLDFSSIYMFIRAKTTVNPHGQTQKLVTTGSYKRTRNPMYLGLALLLTGWGIKSGYILTPIATALFVILINILFIKIEEQRLTEAFGKDYTEYCKRTRRWI